MKDNCKNCGFCIVNDHGQAECRRHAPIAIPTQQQNRLGGKAQMAIVTLWPPVQPELWCGDHMPAPATLEIKG
jgi:hypothetical protein